MRRFVSLEVGFRHFVALGLLAAALGGLAGCSHSSQTRAQAAEEVEPPFDVGQIKTIGDVTEVGNVRPIQVSGVGLVSGLEGTGGPAPAGLYRKMLEDELRRLRVDHIKELLESPNYSLVLVTGLIPAGAHKGDPIDVEVSLPPGSKTTSLRGGMLHECVLKNFDSTKNLNPQYNGQDKLIGGHILAKAKGPLLVGFGDGDDAARARKARIWDGAVIFLDRPFYMVLNNDHKFTKVASSIADRINLMFPDDSAKRIRVRQQQRMLVLDEVTENLNHQFQAPPLGRRETAKALTKEVVTVHVPDAYRLNPERYLRVARLIPLRESPETQGKYKIHLERMLLDPARTLPAALRLEALGRESMPTLQKGLRSEHPLVRFASAEALAYLASPSGGEELAKLAEQHAVLCVYCLSALASLDETISREKLVELLSCPIPEVRFGAFRALRALDEWTPELQGEQLADAFWLHRVAPGSTPLVAFATSRRAEIVCFGGEAKLMPPLKILAGGEFTITAERIDDRCTVSRFSTTLGSIQRKQCSFRLNDVLRTMAAMGGQYNDAVAVLRELDRNHCLNCPIQVDPLPDAMPVEVLAAAGAKDDAKFQNLPHVLGAVKEARDDLGATPLLFRREATFDSAGFDADDEAPRPKQQTAKRR